MATVDDHTIKMINKALQTEREAIIMLCKKKIQSPELCERVIAAIKDRPYIETSS